MSKSKSRLIAAAILAIAVTIISAISWPYIRQDWLLRLDGESAQEAYVMIYRPQPVCYRLSGDGVDALARIIRNDTAADPLPTRATGVLAEVIFLADDGSPSLHCSLHSLPGPKTAKSIEERFDNWERMIVSIGNAKRVPCEVIEQTFNGKVSNSFRRRTKS